MQAGIAGGENAPPGQGRLAVPGGDAPAGALDDGHERHHVVRYIIDRCVRALIEQTQANLDAARVRSVDDVRAAGRRLAGYPEPMASQVKQLKLFLQENMYRHYRVVRMGNKAGRILSDLFHSYVSEPGQLPPHYQEQLEHDGVHRVVCDYIAGMTDRFAVDEHQKLFDPTVRV